MTDVIYWPSFFFLFFSALACAFALAVVLTSNIVRMAFYLVLSLGATAGLFFLAGADFVGAMQLLIYVGGTLVLLVFGVMLTSQSQFISMKTRKEEFSLTILVGACLLAVLVWAALSVPEWRAIDRAAAEAVPLENTASPLAMGLLGIRVDGIPHGYLLIFEVVSVHLLVVLIGAAYLARAKRKQRVAVD
jgi:NADH:ubiquinone oxidoreductase subunit 6 (subunit J)